MGYSITRKGESSPPTAFIPNGFNYGSLDLLDATKAKKAAASIRKLHTAAQKSLIHVGRELASIKMLLKHGQFLDWIRCEFGMEPRTAQRYISVAERLGDNEKLLNAIPARVQYALAAPSTPVGFVDAVMADLEQGRGLPPDILGKIVEAKATASSLKGKPGIKASSVKEEAILAAVAILEAHLSPDVCNDFAAKCKAAGWTQLADHLGTVHD